MNHNHRKVGIRQKVIKMSKTKLEYAPKCPLCGKELHEDEEGDFVCECGWEDQTDRADDEIDYDALERDYPEPSDEEIKEALSDCVDTIGDKK
jgi:tRNA(Ile2) C34 agmatinyltransferase TiaS